jgi:hypothetical protein
LLTARRALPTWSVKIDCARKGRQEEKSVEPRRHQQRRNTGESRGRPDVVNIPDRSRGVCGDQEK